MTIRIGNDIKIVATVTRRGVAEDFTGKTLRLLLVSAGERLTLTPEVAGNVLTYVWLGSEQKKTGAYKLTLIEDYGEGHRNTVDACGLLTLSPCSHEDRGRTGTQTVAVAMDISMPEADDII